MQRPPKRISGPDPGLRLGGPFGADDVLGRAVADFDLAAVARGCGYGAEGWGAGHDGRAIAALEQNAS
jgi:hypothetical protein